MFFFYHLVNLETILSYEIGILAIFTLFFTFVGIKSEVNKKFDTMLKRNGQKNEVGSELTPEQIDIVNTRINKRRTSILGLLDDMGRTFRINIYSGLVSIVFLFILLKIQDDFPKTSGAFEVIILFIFAIQLFGLFLNVRRFKKIYSLDIYEELERERSIYLALAEGLKEIQEKMDEKRLKHLQRKLARLKENWIQSLYKDIKSLFKIKLP